MHKVLIANRGEIAVRVIRACRELGLKTVAVHSVVDKDSLHTKIADESICIGPGPSQESYLSIPAIMSAVEIAGVDAVHPGYGFLSENAEFANICREYKITFIGPSPENIRTLGDKVSARKAAKDAGVPLLPGSQGVVKSEAEALELAEKIGFPLIIKATAGGGGRGMKIVRSKKELNQQFALAQSEAQVGFGNPDCFIERYCERPRHVEIQFIGDSKGNFVHLGERDCSIQRRHQKLIEEAPCPVVDPKMRRKLGATVLKMAKKIGYESVGTAEFLLDEDGSFYFMEVNTRIQVEHTVTEEVTGVDLVKEQIKVAQGLPLSFKQSDITLEGHAIECRINAEDPVSFAPWPGRISAYHEPGGPGIRMDSMVYAGYTVPSNYDSLLAKLVAKGKDREEAIVRMERALEELKVDGIRTNTLFHRRVMQSKAFQDGVCTTRFFEDFVKKFKKRSPTNKKPSKK